MSLMVSLLSFRGLSFTLALDCDGAVWCLVVFVFMMCFFLWFRGCLVWLVFSAGLPVLHEQPPVVAGKILSQLFYEFPIRIPICWPRSFLPALGCRILVLPRAFSRQLSRCRVRSHKAHRL